ncbi:MAG: potassium channel family protein [Huintestinicola sp.]
MRSVLIIGMGRFGKHLTSKFAELGADVMAVDNREENIREVMHCACNVKIADCTNEEALRSLGVGNFDICFVCIGSNFQASLEITSLLKEMGAKKVISKASTVIHAKFLARNGADEVVYPERDRAEKLAVQYSVSNIFDFIELSEDTGIYETPVIPSWTGHSIIELNIRSKYKLNILAIKKEDELFPLPAADYVFERDDHMVILGRQKDVEKLLKLIKD